MTNDDFENIKEIGESRTELIEKLRLQWDSGGSGVLEAFWSQALEIFIKGHIFPKLLNGK